MVPSLSIRTRLNNRNLDYVSSGLSWCTRTIHGLWPSLQYSHHTHVDFDWFVNNPHDPAAIAVEVEFCPDDYPKSERFPQLRIAEHNQNTTLCTGKLHKWMMETKPERVWVIAYAVTFK